MTRFRKILLHILYLLPIFLFIQGFSIVPFYYASKYYSLAAGWTYAGLAMSIPFFSLMLTGRHIRSLFIFILIHFFIGLIFILLPLPPFIRGVFILFYSIVVIISFAERLIDKPRIIGIGSITFYIGGYLIMYVLMGYLNIPVHIGLFVLYSTITLLCCFTFTHVRNLDEYLSLITMNGENIQPVGSVISFNNKLILVFIALTAIVAFLARFTMVDRLVVLAGYAVLILIRFLLSLANMNADSEDLVPTPDPPPSGSNNMDIFLEPAETGLLWIILERLLTIVMWIMLAAFLIFIVGYSAYRLYKAFHQQQTIDGDIKEFITPEFQITKEKLYSMLQKRFSPVFGNTPNQQIRKLFYKKVKKNIKLGMAVETWHTSKIIAKNLPDSENVQELEELYEEARYGDKEIDSAKLKNVLAKIK